MLIGGRAQEMELDEESYGIGYNVHCKESSRLGLNVTKVYESTLS